MDTVTVTKHGEQRMKQRAGIKRGASERAAQKAFEQGLRIEETSGRLHDYLRRSYATVDLRVYNHLVFLFDEGRVVTVINLPKELKADFEAALRRKKAVDAGKQSESIIDEGADIVNKLAVFNSQEFGQVRMVDVEGKVYAVGVDIARALDYANPSKAIIDHCKGITKLGIPSAGGIQETNVIPEGDIIRMIVKAADQSQNPLIKAKAERFERWVFDEVVPSVLKTGTYTKPSAPASDLKARRVEIMDRNARTRQAGLMFKFASMPGIPDTYKQILAAQAMESMTGKKLLPLPTVTRPTYTATEIGEMLGVSANKIGRTANENGLKTSEYGVEVWDKSQHGPKEVPTWRYYDTAIPHLARALGVEVPEQGGRKNAV